MVSVAVVAELAEGMPGAWHGALLVLLAAMGGLVAALTGGNEWPEGGGKSGSGGEGLASPLSWGVAELRFGTASPV